VSDGDGVAMAYEDEDDGLIHPGRLRAIKERPYGAEVMGVAWTLASNTTS
jgi:hypothetical protein